MSRPVLDLAGRFSPSSETKAIRARAAVPSPSGRAKSVATEVFAKEFQSMVRDSDASFAQERQERSFRLSSQRGRESPNRRPKEDARPADPRSDSEQSRLIGNPIWYPGPVNRPAILSTRAPGRVLGNEDEAAVPRLKDRKSPVIEGTEPSLERKQSGETDQGSETKQSGGGLSAGAALQ